MAPVLTPWQAAQDALACLVIGCCTGLLRTLAPAKGRAAFLPDFIWVGLLLTLLQGFAAGYSASSALRWYMLAAGGIGALAAHSLFAPLTAWLAAAVTAPLRLLGGACLRPVKNGAKKLGLSITAQKNKRRIAKKQKKSLQKPEHMLYNSNM